MASLLLVLSLHLSANNKVWNKLSVMVESQSLHICQASQVLGQLSGTLIRDYSYIETLFINHGVKTKLLILQTIISLQLTYKIDSTWDNIPIDIAVPRAGSLREEYSIELREAELQAISSPTPTGESMYRSWQRWMRNEHIDQNSILTISGSSLQVP